MDRAFKSLLLTAFVGWSTAWCCGHPVLFDVTDLFGHSHHDHDHDHDASHHSHGPFDHDHDGPEDGDHGVEKIGIDRCIRADDRLALRLEEGPGRPLVDLHPALAAELVTPPPRMVRDGPLRSSAAPGRSVIRSTERWLI